MDNAEALRARLADAKKNERHLSREETMYWLNQYREIAMMAVDHLTDTGYVRVPVENGKNRYGLDMSYFRNVINRELNRPLDNYKPDELARVCLRIGRTADEDVLREREFQPAATKETSHD